MGKRHGTIVLCWLLLLGLGLCACGQGRTDSNEQMTWQEQYDLGVRYLEEGNYEEAIIAFTAAIEIDPKQAPAYVGRGDAYIGSGETEENLAAALADYETVIGLDEANVDAYLGLADVYIRMGEYEKAYQTLKDALEKTGNDQSIADKIAEMESGVYTDSANHVRRSNDYDLDGTLRGYTIYSYDFLGRRCSWENYYREYNEEGEYVGGITMDNYCEVEFDQENRPSRYQFYAPDGTPTEYDTFVYNERGLTSEQYRYEADGTLLCYFYFYYDEQGRETKYEGYHANGEMYSYWVSEYDAAGNLIKETEYDPDGTEMGYSLYD